MTNKFVDTIKDYQAAQQSYKVAAQKKATRQIQIIQPKLTDAQAQEIVSDEGDHEGGLEGWCKKQILQFDGREVQEQVR